MKFLWSWLITVTVLGVSGCGTMKGWFSDEEYDSREPVVIQKIDEQVRLRSVWSRGFGDGQGEGGFKINHFLAQGTIYTASADGQVIGLNAETGRVLWKRELDLKLSGGVGHYRNSIFVGSPDGLVLRLSSLDGSEIWRTVVSSEVLSAPQADGKYVVSQTYDGKLVGLDFETGHGCPEFSTFGAGSRLGPSASVVL